MPVSMDALADDLAAESAVLRALLADLDERGWLRDTPAAGWTIADQVSHLAHFDDAAVRSATEPDAFRVAIATAAEADPEVIARRHRGRSGVDLLGWFDTARSRLIAAFREVDPALRVPWFGPAVSAASSLTARIMETWAHGQDVADALGVLREPTARLRHIAHIGVGARPFSFRLHGRRPPTAPIRVQLDAPDGEIWGWGPEDSADRVTGPALDFCLAVTQRRHVADTALELVGPAAREWMGIAQAFAGTAGQGRRPGQFTGE
jgi:uncharacterized protein (TIGR03084 family)